MCSVAGCNSSRRSAQRFKLPEDPEERLEWVMFIAKVNKQCFKESSWTDISVCSEHFPDDCLVNVNDGVQLKPGAVPSLCLSMGAEESSEWEVSVPLSAENQVEFTHGSRVKFRSKLCLQVDVIA